LSKTEDTLDVDPIQISKAKNMLQNVDVILNPAAYITQQVKPTKSDLSKPSAIPPKAPKPSNKA
jgi:hypothetical protein